MLKKIGILYILTVKVFSAVRGFLLISDTNYRYFAPGILLAICLLYLILQNAEEDDLSVREVRRPAGNVNFLVLEHS